MDFINSFINDYFLQPMGHFYTWPATIVYAAIFITAVFLVYKYILKRMKIAVDNNFIMALLPFIILGGVMRSLEDAEFYQGYLVISPGIYITIFFITIATLLISLQLEKRTKRPYWHFMLAIGSVILLYNIIQVVIIGVSNWTGLMMIAGLMALWALLLFPVTKYLPNYLSRTNYFILLAQLLDGTASAVSMNYFPYVEQHVVPNLFIPIFGPWVMIPLKLLVVWPLLYLLDNTIKENKHSGIIHKHPLRSIFGNRDFMIWLKIVIIILGLALGTRNLLRLAMMV